MSHMAFERLAGDGPARRGRLRFPRGTVETPVFMPVGTYGTVKAMTPEELEVCGAELIVANTFHLMLRPGAERIAAHGDLHGFMHWEKPILTDSGGFQVYSLGDMRRISEEGVSFRSPVNGDAVFLDAEISMAVQRALGSDIVMAFDDCTPLPATEAETRESMERTLRWAARSREAHGESAAALFGIVQGGLAPSLRRRSLEGLLAIGFDGYALGGLSVGETREEREAVLDQLPERTDNTFWTGMTAQQRRPYRRQAVRVATLVRQGRALSGAEIQKLLRALTRMRMLCNGLWGMYRVIKPMGKNFRPLRSLS